MNHRRWASGTWLAEACCNTKQKHWFQVQIMGDRGCQSVDHPWLVSYPLEKWTFWGSALSWHKHSVTWNKFNLKLLIDAWMFRILTCLRLQSLLVFQIKKMFIWKWKMKKKDRSIFKSVFWFPQDSFSFSLLVSTWKLLEYPFFHDYSALVIQNPKPECVPHTWTDMIVVKSDNTYSPQESIHHCFLC